MAPAASPSTVVTARWILPIDRPPIEHGWIEIANGRVVRTGGPPAPSGARDWGSVAILPGLVNAHTHLELSWLAGRVAPAASMDEWITALVRVRRASAESTGDQAQAMAEAARAMRRAGTVLVGDVSNTLATPAVLAEAGLGGVVFHELLGFNAADPAGAVRDAWARVDRAAGAIARRSIDPPIAIAVVAHAPYSVSAALFQAIRARADGTPLSIHLAESPEEIEFLRTGRGPIRRMLETLGAWSDAWDAPACDPVQYVSNLGYLRPGTLIVHAVHVTDAGLDRLRDAGAVIVTCPRSNEWVGGGIPRLSHFYASGVPVAIGTDSLASSPSLSLFDELAELRRLAPDVSAACLLESATRTGAQALGFGATYGTIGPGKRAAFAVVDVPPGVADVEEYLVGGVPESAIHAPSA